MRKFIRTRAPADARPPALALAPATHKTNGGTNGVGSCLLYDEHSTLSSGCWEGAGAAGGARLWEDAEFPAGAGAGRRARRTRWARPHELCVRPRFLGDAAVEAGAAETGAAEAGAAEVGVGEAEALRAVGAAAWGEARGGALGAAAAALALTPRLLARAAPPHSFRAGYCGRFTFRFWVFGTWREVVVDDRLPVPSAPHTRTASADFTLALLEKAYAKLLGGYAAARAGGVARALQDLSGGVVQSFAPPRQPRAALLHVLRAALPRATLLAAHAPRAPLALVTGAARAADGAVLLRLRAPAAAPPPEWRAGAAPADGDACWMPFAQFAATFARLELVHVGPDEWALEPALRARRPWRAVLARRRWRRGYNAGGPPRARTAHCNPQFRVQVAGGVRAHVVVALAQEAGAREAGVGFAVFAGSAAGAPLEGSHACRAREVATFFTLAAGQYVVVAHAARAHVEAAFLLRILADEHIDVWEVNDDNAILQDAAGEPAPPGTGAALRGLPAAAALDARALRARLRRVWRRVLPARPALALCRALVALRDPGVSGRMPARDLPALLALLALWRAALAALAPRCGRAPSAYRLRELLRACGVSASNKVLECVVLRYARGARLPPAAAVLALARLHLAHERYRSLEAKLKANPLSLEEMILMTIYS